MIRYLISLAIIVLLLLILKDWFHVGHFKKKSTANSRPPKSSRPTNKPIDQKTTDDLDNELTTDQKAGNDQDDNLSAGPKATLPKPVSSSNQKATFSVKWPQSKKAASINQPALKDSSAIKGPAADLGQSDSSILVQPNAAKTSPTTGSKAAPSKSTKPTSQTAKKTRRFFNRRRTPLHWTNAAQPINWSGLLATRSISNSAYLEQLQQWDRHLSMVADHDEMAAQARLQLSDAQKNAFFQDAFPGLRFLAYELTKTYAWYSHQQNQSPNELARLAAELGMIVHLHARANQLLLGDTGERRVYQLLQELYPHEELLDSLNLPFDYYQKSIAGAVNQIDIVLVTRNGILIPEVKNYQGLALQLDQNGSFIIAYPNGYCDQIPDAFEQLTNHEHAVSHLLFGDPNARQILMTAQPVIHSMFIAANPQQTIMAAAGMRDRLYSISQLDQLANFKAKRPLTGLEQRYLKELLASRSTSEREYEEPVILNLAKLERQMLAMVALNDQYLDDNSPVTRFISSDTLADLHRADLIDDHCRLR